MNGDLYETPGDAALVRVAFQGKVCIPSGNADKTYVTGKPPHGSAW